MNKYLNILFFLLIGSQSWAQVIPGLTFETYSNNYISVHSYNGVTAANAYTMRFQYSGTNLNVPNWKISARITQPIISTDGISVFPPEMLSFQAVSTSGQNPSGAVPTLSQIGMPPSVSLNGLNETFLIPQSNVPLYNITQYNSYYDLRIDYNLTVAAGAYLQALQGGHSQKRYTVHFEFRSYGQHNQVIGMQRRTYTIDVFRLGNAPEQLLLQITGTATNGLLEIQTPTDYVNGASVLYPSSLSVVANVGYQLKARSINPEFTSSNGNSIPLNSVKLELIPVTGNTATAIPIMLSTAAQTIATGNATGNSSVFYDIKYSTLSNNPNLIQVSSGIYGTVLEYQITPQ